MSRWPGRHRPPAPIEPPAWFRSFTPEDWAEPGDDQVRYPAGALMGAEEVARRRWLDACRTWAKENDMDVVEWLKERRRARLGRLASPQSGPRYVEDDDDKAGW